MTTILIPVDGSQHSVRALETALSVASLAEEVKLHVITVQAPIVSGNVTRFISAENLKSYYEEEGRKALDPLKDVIAKAGDAVVSQEVLVGPIAETIVEYAQKHGCDRIIMGTRGLGRVTGLVLGSVTTKVISLAEVPVTRVK